MESNRHSVIFLPQFYPELNKIEKVWAQAKRSTKVYYKYKLLSLWKKIILGLQLECLCWKRSKLSWKSTTLQVFVPWRTCSRSELENNVAKNKKAVKSHQKIGVSAHSLKVGHTYQVFIRESVTSWCSPTYHHISKKPCWKKQRSSRYTGPMVRIDHT